MEDLNEKTELTLALIKGEFCHTLADRLQTVRDLS